MRTLEQFEADWKARHTLLCPYCGAEIDTSDSDFTQHNVTYWAEDDPVENDCPKCNRTFYAKEHIERTWTSGKTKDEAAEL
jgi:ssDNA-binding Zn-finger/Zn-ribbon topoisomerase 1